MKFYAFEGIIWYLSKPQRARMTLSAEARVLNEYPLLTNTEVRLRHQQGPGVPGSIPGRISLMLLYHEYNKDFHGTGPTRLCIMEAQQLIPSRALVKTTFQLGSETYSAQANKGLISEQLNSVKEQSMSILKDFITNHNIPNDVPDEPEEISSEDDDEMSPKPPMKKSKKRQ